MTAGRSSCRGGWESAHVAIDDLTRLAYAEVVPEEPASTAANFLTRARALARCAALGIAVVRILTDNGNCYRGLPVAKHAIGLGITERYSRLYRPQTNCRAERFICALLQDWAYVRPDARSGWRKRALPLYLPFFANERCHSALGNRTPAQRLALDQSTT